MSAMSCDDLTRDSGLEELTERTTSPRRSDRAEGRYPRTSASASSLTSPTACLILLPIAYHPSSPSCAECKMFCWREHPRDHHSAANYNRRDSVWFCCICGNGPISDWREVCEDCEHRKCEDCEVSNKNSRGPATRSEVEKSTNHVTCHSVGLLGRDFSSAYEV